MLFRSYHADWYPSETSKGGVINGQAVKDMIEIAYDLKWPNPPMAVYWKFVPKSDMIVNSPLLSVIKEIKGYGQFWSIKKREYLELGLMKRMQKQERLQTEAQRVS